MQTKLSDYLTKNTLCNTLTSSTSLTSSNPLTTGAKDAAYTECYPKSCSASRDIRVDLQLLGTRSFTRYFVRSTFAPRSPPFSPFARDRPPAVQQVVSPSHATRSNEDGEPLLSSAEIFKNCIAGIAWDPKDEFFIALRRSRFQLFGAVSMLNNIEKPQGTTSPLLDLKTTTVQNRLGAENRMSFGLSTTQFLGNTLNAICGYNGAAKVDVFDLEDLDEESGEALRTYDLGATLNMESESELNNHCTATAIASVSDVVALAAMSNGTSVFLDLRNPKPILCTKATNAVDILSTNGSSVSRASRRKHNTAITVLRCGTSTQIITGAKSGQVELWDLRRCDQPVTATAVGGSVETLNCVSSRNSTRCGAPLVWLNTDIGSISCFGVGATSFEEISSVKTKDTLRSHNSANLSAPKLSVMPANSLLVYPYISSNAVLIYDAKDIEQGGLTRTRKRPKTDYAQAEGQQARTKPAYSDFQSAKALLYGQSETGYSGLSSFLELETEQPVPSLIQSLPFNEWSFQISCVSAANQHDAIAVGGDDGDIHLLRDSSQ